MQVPNKMKQVIADTFYDKTVSVLGQTSTVEADGAVNKSHTTVTSTFKANVRLVNFKQVQEEYGIDYQIDVAISCDTSVSIVVGDLVEYGGIRYEVTDVLPRDSHTMIVGKRWQHQQ